MESVRCSYIGFCLRSILFDRIPNPIKAAPTKSISSGSGIAMVVTPAEVWSFLSILAVRLLKERTNKNRTKIRKNEIRKITLFILIILPFK